MKRFYCTVCKRIKRVRNMPRLVESPEAEVPTDRIGVCNRHMPGYVSKTRAPKRIPTRKVG